MDIAAAQLLLRELDIPIVFVDAGPFDAGPLDPAPRSPVVAAGSQKLCEQLAHIVATRRIRVGCSGWNYADWRDVVYPKGPPQSRWLEHYSTLFETVEVNSTFYRLPKRESVARWVEQTPDDFVFAVKASRYLTHIRRLRDLEGGAALLRADRAPRSNAEDQPSCGSSANFRRDDKRLLQALAALPNGRHAFEFRHELVQARGVRAPSRSWSRTRHQRPPGASVPGARADRGLDVHPLTAGAGVATATTPRPSSRSGRCASTAGGAGQRSTVQQRLARLCGQERTLAQEAARRLTVATLKPWSNPPARR